jgi:N-acetylglucosaminyl-diphospho-decaprenol L-rhamnosyltransferase
MSIRRTDDAQTLLDVVIVNWNTGDCLRTCLKSLAAAAAGLRLGPTVVVDNASRDGSATQLPSPPDVVLIENSTNVGFAAACNQGACVGSAPYLLFLNPDTVLLPDTLRLALTFMDSAVGAPYGICGGLVLHPDGRPGISASRFPTLANVMTETLGLQRIVRRWVAPRHLEANELTGSCPIDQVVGAFFLVRRSVFDRLEGLDERYFLYYEEVDFCRRAASLGISAYMLIEARLYHIGNVSAKQSGGRALFYSLRSRTLYAGRHWSAAETFILVVFTLTLEMPARFLRAALRLDLREAIALVRTVGSYLVFLGQAGMRRSLVRGDTAGRDQSPAPPDAARSADDRVSIPAGPTIAVALRQANDHRG